MYRKNTFGNPANRVPKAAVKFSTTVKKVTFVCCVNVSFDCGIHVALLLLLFVWEMFRLGSLSEDRTDVIVCCGFRFSKVPCKLGEDPVSERNVRWRKKTAIANTSASF